MSNGGYHGTCSICGSRRICTPVEFYPGKVQDSMLVKPYTGVRYVTFPGEVTAYCCEKCGKKNGKAPKGVWITYIIGSVLILAGVLLGMTDGNAMGPCIALAIAGWLMTLITGWMLVFKGRHGKGPAAMGLGLFAATFPPLGQIYIALSAKSVNRASRAVTALKAELESRNRIEREKLAAISAKTDNGMELTEEEQIVIDVIQKRKEAAEQQAEYAREQAQEAVNRGNLRGGVIGIVITVFLGIYGANVYSSGRGYMELFHSIKLSPGGFAAVIGVLLLWDIIALVNAVKKR